MVLDVKSFVNSKKEEYAKIKRNLLIIQVGCDSASNAYIRGKMNDCSDVGWYSNHVWFADGVSSNKICEHIYKYGADYDGIILQKPAKISGNEDDILKAIRPYQDVDGFRADSPHTPCTPLGILMLMKHYAEATRKEFPLNGKNVCVIGRGQLVGKPMVSLLSKETNANIIWLNSHSGESIHDFCKFSDVIITATGQRNLITSDDVSDGCLVIDAGITFDDNGKIGGDCSKELYKRDGIWITKTPGGVGLTTRLAILENLKNSRQYR